MSTQLFHGDCIEVMASLPAESVDAIITSPPYAEQRKSTYGGIVEAHYHEWTVAWMAEVRRLLKPDGSAIINIRPHIKDGVLSDYVLRTRLALRDEGWAELGEMVWHKNGMPTGSPRRPRRSWESLHWFGKHGRAWSDAKAAGEPTDWPTKVHNTGRAARNGWDHLPSGGGSTPAIARVSDVVRVNIGRDTKWSEANVQHPAPFPWRLAEWCGKLICPPGGTILDPFSGSASTGVAAIRNGWDYIGIDAVAEYVEMSRRRLDAEQAKQAPTEGPFSCPSKDDA